jgi:hypothetical protein
VRWEWRESNPRRTSQNVTGPRFSLNHLAKGAVVHIIQSYAHRFVLLLEVSVLKAELQKMSSAVPQEKKAQGQCEVQFFHAHNC